jgi:DNA-binding MarR family transcriptional regulator
VVNELPEKKYMKQFIKMSYVFSKRMHTYIDKKIMGKIAPPHIFLLNYLDENGPCIVTDISHQLGITLSGVTNLANKLAKLKFITRERSEGDRRIVVLALTTEGKKMLDCLEESLIKVLEKSFKGLSEDEIDEFFRIHQKMCSNLMQED